MVPLFPIVPMETMLLIRSDESKFQAVGKAVNEPGEITFPAIQKFPEELHRSVKSRAALKGISIKQFVEQALRYALNNDDIIQKTNKTVESKNEDGQRATRHDSAPNAGTENPENT